MLEKTRAHAIMKAVQVHGPNDVRVDKVPRPRVGRHDVLLKIHACGICGSDLTFARYGFQREGGAPWPLGHEAAGIVVEVGASVKGILPGLRVAVNPMGDFDNVIGNGGPEGALADYLLVRDAILGQHLLEIPEAMTAKRAALAEPFAVALHSVNQGNVTRDDKVAVFGAGPIGLGAIFWLHRRGVRQILAIDLSDARLAIARKLGATATINPNHEDLLDSLQRAHGAAALIARQPAAATDVFFDMAGGPTILADIIKMAQMRARIILTAVYAAPVTLNLQLMLLKELTLTTSIGYPKEFPEALQVLSELGDAEIEPYVSSHFTFKAFEQAFDTAKLTSGAKVMVSFN